MAGPFATVHGLGLRVITFVWRYFPIFVTFVTQSLCLLPRWATKQFKAKEWESVGQQSTRINRTYSDVFSDLILKLPYIVTSSRQRSPVCLIPCIHSAWSSERHITVVPCIFTK